MILPKVLLNPRLAAVGVDSGEVDPVVSGKVSDHITQRRVAQAAVGANSDKRIGASAEQTFPLKWGSGDTKERQVAEIV